MNLRVRYALAFLILFAGSTARAENVETLNRWLEDVIESHNMAGLTTVVVRGGKTVFKRSYGETRVGSGTAMSTRHFYHVASVSKPFVAIAVMQLVEQGKVELDAPVTTYLPYFTMADERLPQVTVRRLLSHKAGMPDVDDYEWQAPQTDDHALERWVRAQAGKELLFDPGTDRQYSNIGFEILGDLVAKVSGLTFEAYIKQNILTPAGMASSTFLRSEVPMGLRVNGHTGLITPRALDYYPYNRRHAPSSTLHLNGDEFATWLNVVANRDRFAASGILNAASIKEMWTVQFEDSETAKMTHSWFWRMTDEGALLRHGGGDDGFRSEMAVFEARDAGYGLMSNGENAPMSAIRTALRTFAAGKPLPPLPVNKAQNLATLLETEGPDALIAEFASRVAAEDGATAFLIYGIAREAFESGDRKTAETLAEGMAKTYPDHPRINTFLGEVKFAMKKYDEAGIAAKRALDATPDDAEAKDLVERLTAVE